MICTPNLRTDSDVRRRWLLWRQGQCGVHRSDDVMPWLLCGGLHHSSRGLVNIREFIYVEMPCNKRFI